MDTDSVQKKIIEYLRDRRKAELLALVMEELRHLDRQDALDIIHMQAIHHDIMQIFYGFLTENHIQVHWLFQDKVFREMNERAEYSLMDMVRYTGTLYDITFQQIDSLRKSDSVVANVRQYIEEHFEEDICREDIAASFFVTPNYLSRIFREKTGMVLREYINICRVGKAKSLLSTMDYSVTEVALMVGFGNVSYFSTVFKRHCKITPAAWKNELGKRQSGEPEADIITASGSGWIIE